MIKKSIGLLAGMLVTVAVYAAGAQLRTDHPDSYTVRKGDTLWDISSRFLSKPWLWPEIWQANPQVQNPHLIYPGDVLNLSFINGGPHVGLQPRIHAEGEPVSAVPTSQLGLFLKNLKVLVSDDVKRLPYVMGFEENDIRGYPGRKIYARKLDAQPGQRFLVVRPTAIYRAHGSKLISRELDNDVTVAAGPWTELSRWNGHGNTNYGDDDHLTAGTDLGTEVQVIGHAEVLASGDISSLLLLDSTYEVRAGDRLMPVDQDIAYDDTYFPHAAKAAPDGTSVIAFTTPEGYDAVGPHQVVVINIGKNDGVDNGSTFSVYEVGEYVDDDVAHNSWNRGTGSKHKLPDEFVGHVMVFRTFDHVAYALVMDSLRPIHKGAIAKLPE